jgi:colanic acid biosynthesis glycosyl transferase WcaI
VRILLIGINFAPELTGVGKYTGEMTEWLARRGHTITTVTTPPHYPLWKIEDGYKSWAWRSETTSGSRVIRCPVYIPSSNAPRPSTISVALPAA